MIRTLLLICCTIRLCAQPGTKVYPKPLKSDSVFGDCSMAREIVLENDKRIWKTQAPKGGGEVNEFDSKTTYSFDGEHHSAWYKLIIRTPGKLMFDIIPTNPCDDYDFMLFKATSGNFCEGLLTSEIKPVRACISRNKDELRGRTGLNNRSEEEYIKAGVAAAYCKYVEVSAGDVFYLVLDNVYDKGSGHSIEFTIATDISIKGLVTDDFKKPLKADISFTNNKGDTLLSGKTKKDGSYDFTVPISQNQTYSLHFYSDSNFVFSKNVTIKDTAALKALQTVLPKLKKGKKYAVGSINFVGNEINYLPAAIPALNNLVRLMKKNKGLKIKIVGHCNMCSVDGPEYALSFTRGRAQSVKTFLVFHGIDDSRLEIDGRSDLDMLYHQPENEWQAEQNRRVETMVLEY